jgi:hypothetical protein
MIYNRAFDVSLVNYVPGYDNALHFSPRFRRYAEALASRLIRDYRLSGGVIGEIGCGDGYFLDLMTAHGVHLGIGYDPTVAAERRSLREGTLVQIIPELFEGSRLPPKLDALICRHVLEHLFSPLGFMMDLRTTLGTRSPLLCFEVPNMATTLQKLRFAEIIYEHFTYWTSITLGTLFIRSGFAPLRVSTGSDDQFLSIEARPSGRSTAAQELPTAAELAQNTACCSRFGAQYASQVFEWQKIVSDLGHRGRVAVVWGAGARGITFLNLAMAKRRVLAGIVDVNPRKWGKYAPGCGLPVIAPAQLPSLRPDIVLLANEIYEREVREMVMSYGLDPKICII